MLISAIASDTAAAGPGLVYTLSIIVKANAAEAIPALAQTPVAVDGLSGPSIPPALKAGGISVPLGEAKTVNRT